MSQKWNLQDIRPAGQKPKTMHEAPPARPKLDIAQRAPHRSEPEPALDPDLATIDIIDGNTAKRKRVITTTVIAAIILALGFTMNVLLSGAQVTVYPKIKDISVQAAFTAHSAPPAGELAYELLTLEETGEKQVKAAGKEEVSLRAEGKIFVYNTKPGASQRLIKNTRFESPEGLIYRIQESIEVPGATTDAKGTIVPGKVVTDVFADATGEQYNISPAKFTVPGLKGSEQFDTVYGESNAAFTGGFEGEKYIIDENELSTAQQALHIELRNKLLEKLKQNRPAGFVVYDNAITFAYDSLPATEYGDSLATIKENVRLQVPMFKEDQFAKFLAQSSVPEYKNEDVTLNDPQTLSFEYTSSSTSIADIATLSSLEFMLRGTTKLVWDFDAEKLKTELVGLKKNDSTAVFSKYLSISHAQAEIRPFWAGSFPDTAKEIDVVTILEERK